VCGDVAADHITTHTTDRLSGNNWKIYDYFRFYLIFQTVSCKLGLQSTQQSTRENSYDLK